MEHSGALSRGHAPEHQYKVKTNWETVERGKGKDQCHQSASQDPSEAIHFLLLPLAPEADARVSALGD